MTRFNTGRCRGLYAAAITRDNVTDADTGQHARFITADADDQAGRVATLLNDQPDLADMYVWHHPDTCTTEGTDR